LAIIAAGIAVFASKNDDAAQTRQYRQGAQPVGTVCRNNAFAIGLRDAGVYRLDFWGLPSALGLYWVTSSLFTIGQQYVTLKNNR